MQLARRNLGQFFLSMVKITIIPRLNAGIEVIVHPTVQLS